MGIEMFSDGSVFLSGSPELRAHKADMRRITTQLGDKPWASAEAMLADATAWAEGNSGSSLSEARGRLEKRKKALENLEAVEKSGFLKRWWGRLKVSEVRNFFALLAALAAACAVYGFAGHDLLVLGYAIGWSVCDVCMLCLARWKTVNMLKASRDQVKHDEADPDLNPSSRTVAAYLRSELERISGWMPNTGVIRQQLQPLLSPRHDRIEGTRLSRHTEADPRALDTLTALKAIDTTLALLKDHTERVAVELLHDENGGPGTRERLDDMFERANEAFELLYAAGNIATKDCLPRTVEDIAEDPDWRKLNWRLLELKPTVIAPDAGLRLDWS